MKLAVMQPYIFPYIGYFQLINSVDIFVIYDDVNFIKRGWINRNKILVNGQETLITFPCIKISQNKLIKDTKIDIKDKSYSKIIRTISLNYNKAPYYNKVISIIEGVFKSEIDNIADLATKSIIDFSEYLNLPTKFSLASVHNYNSRGKDKADRLIDITIQNGASEYINPIGGVELYEKDYFKNKGVELKFLQPSVTEYQQFGEDFIPNLSIIDIAMFNSPSDIRKMLNNIKLI